MRLIYRDNLQHRDDIEEAYIHALSKAQKRAVIANAYFFPGYRLLREIRNAADRFVLALDDLDRVSAVQDVPALNLARQMDRVLKLDDGHLVAI